MTKTKNKDIMMGMGDAEWWEMMKNGKKWLWGAMGMMIIQWEQWWNDGNSYREQHEWWKGMARASRRTLTDGSHNKGATWKKKKTFFSFYFFGNKGQWCQGEHYGSQGGKGNYFVFPKWQGTLGACRKMSRAPRRMPRTLDGEE
jgi:hypothetical protein